MASPRILVLGGTTEGRRLAAVLHAHPAGFATISSLAGRTTSPRLPDGEVRIGGFGGIEGLTEFLRAEHIDVVVDATHPFAAGMSHNAAAATGAADVPLLVLRRPGWTEQPGDRWHRVPDLAAAAALTPSLGSRVFLTTGRQSLGKFTALDSCWFLARSVDPPSGCRPRNLRIVLHRGPFTFHSERDLLHNNRIDLLVTKDSGGPDAKLAAARELSIPVIVVDRPPTPIAPTVETVDQAVHWLLTHLS